MISPARFVDELRASGVTFFTGVPDSLLKPFSQYVMDQLPPSEHVITANEGAAIGLALGHHLGTGTTPLVYLQNSGLGNTINPLLSLADPEVYGTPMVVMIGWRGQPGVKDEPQHVKQGRVMVAMLDAMELPHATLPADDGEAANAIREAVDCANRDSTPYFLLVEKGTFATESGTAPHDSSADPTREEALGALVDLIDPTALIVSTTGMLSRELFELRERTDDTGNRDFLTVGGMGHSSSIALGLARAQPDREVWCFDGDGALLMHMGVLATIAEHGPHNYHHAVFNNGVHDSVGGQPTSIDQVDIPALALAAGYGSAATATDLSDLASLVERMRSSTTPSLVELKVRPGARPDLGRPTRTPTESRKRFMAAIDR